MDQKIMDRTSRASVSAATLAVSLSASICGAVSATTYCVTCDGPQAQYACTVDAPAQSSLQIYCISELAKSGKHASCAVNRDQQDACAGIVKTLAAPDGMSVLSPNSGTPPVTQSEQTAKTIEQPARDTVKNVDADEPQMSDDAPASAEKNTGSALEKAGNAVVGAAKKSWSCVTSLFSDC